MYRPEVHTRYSVLFLFIFISECHVAQNLNNLVIDYWLGNLNIGLFKNYKCTTLTETLYETGYFRKKPKFIQVHAWYHLSDNGDTLARCYHLKRNERPDPARTHFFKQDSLGHLYDVTDSLSSSNEYTFKNGEVLTLNGLYHFYDAKNRLIMTVDSVRYYRNQNYFVVNYNYSNDTLTSKEESIYPSRWENKPRAVKRTEFMYNYSGNLSSIAVTDSNRMEINKQRYEVIFSENGKSVEIINPPGKKRKLIIRLEIK